MQSLRFEKVPGWFVEPANEKWHLSPMVVTCSGGRRRRPFLEITIAIGLWFSVASPGPRRHHRPPSVRRVVPRSARPQLQLGGRPWNLAMIALRGRTVYRRQTRRTPSLPGEPSAPCAPLPGFAGLVDSFTLLPTLGYSGKWDSAFSFALYSPNASANIFVTGRVVDQLPPNLRTNVVAFPAIRPAIPGPIHFQFRAVGLLRRCTFRPLLSRATSRSVFQRARHLRAGTGRPA